MPPSEASARAGVEDKGDTSARLKLSDADQKEAVEKQRAFLLDAGQKVRSRGMQLHETKRFLFYTDVPAQIITSTYLPYLDAMYARLCDIYGIDPNINIWKGKASIVVFVDEANFLNFQRTFFSEPGLERVAGLANLRSGGEVVITAHTGNDPKFFAAMLVHETTHGFTFRYFAGRSVAQLAARGNLGMDCQPGGAGQFGSPAARGAIERGHAAHAADGESVLHCQVHRGRTVRHGDKLRELPADVQPQGCPGREVFVAVSPPGAHARLVPSVSGEAADGNAVGKEPGGSLRHDHG